MHTLARRWPTLIALVLAGLTFVDGLPAPEFLAGVLAATTERRRLPPDHCP
ncbi:hypothetical protein [Streptomyces sp. NPDC090445]|uniref:hypothetical protein n=1 Tax=Streptomyces sp. NPDC090445 TaxID=3365963 RepID=UPI0038124B33